MKVVIVLHGSEDPDYVESVKQFAGKAEVYYAFLSHSSPSIREVTGDIYVPLFIGYGGDYDRAVDASGFYTPPILDWPGFRDFLLSLGPGLYVFHGEDDDRFMEEVRKLGIDDVAFLAIRPTLSEYLVGNGCPTKVIPVILTRGVIYKRVVGMVQRLCPSTYVEKPLFELESFAKYFRDSLDWVVNNTRCLRC